MKNILLSICLVFSFAALADIEIDPADVAPVQSEVNQARSCFEEINTLGCGTPKDDFKYFRSCLHEVYPTLTTGCKKIVSGLYGKRLK